MLLLWWWYTPLLFYCGKFLGSVGDRGGGGIGREDIDRGGCVIGEMLRWEGMIVVVVVVVLDSEARRGDAEVSAPIDLWHPISFMIIVSQEWIPSFRWFG